jgi:hypothetical protein
MRHDRSAISGNERTEPVNGILIAAFLPIDLAGEPAFVTVFISTMEIL